MLEALQQHKKEGCADEFSVFTSCDAPRNLASLDVTRWLPSLFRPPSLLSRATHSLRNMVGEGPHLEAWRWFRRTVRLDSTLTAKNKIELLRRSEQFRAERIELLLYPFPVSLALESKIPYVMAIHDLQHRLQPEFPEVSAYGEWERREHLHRNAARHATLLVADSEVGKEDILNCYGKFGVTSDRVKVLPFLQPGYFSNEITDEERRHVRSVYRLPERYFFYPAQFWPHKNHKRIVQAMGLLKEEHGIETEAVFCGSHTSKIRERTFGDVMSAASKAGVERNIRYVGYIPNEDVSAIYAEAAGLVMPTFFGPTNIPVLEAWSTGCPVLTSDIRGIREQVGDAGVLVDPTSVESIAAGIHRLWTENNLRDTMARRGRERLAKYTPETYRQRLIEIVEEAKSRAANTGQLRARSV